MSTEKEVLKLTFGQAMDKAILEGKTVACELWHGEEQLSFNKDKKRVSEEELWNPLNKEVARRNGGYADNMPYATKIDHEQIQLGWQPTQVEMFANWHLADIRHFLDSVVMTGNPANGSNDLELHFYPYDSKALPKSLPYSGLYHHNMLEEGKHVIFASDDMFMNMINCLIYDSALAFYNSRFLNSGHDGFVLKDHMLEDGTWKDFLQQPPSMYTLIDTRENAFEKLVEVFEYSSILIADARNVETSVIQDAIGHADSSSDQPIGVSWIHVDFEQQMDISVREPKDFVE